MSVLLEVDGLTIDARRDDGSLTPIVKGVSFEVKRREVVALIGESGSGKTTIALSALGYVKPGLEFTSGEVRLDGQDVISMPPEEQRELRGQRVAYLAQSAAATFNPALTIGEQVTESPVLHGQLTREQADRRAEELYRALDLPDPDRHGRRYPHQVSGGQLQRAMTAMAMSCRPDLIIFDEPTTALDVTVQKQILDLLASLQEELGMAMILITHDLGVVAGRARRIGVMYAGKMVETAETTTLFHHMNHPYTEALFKSIPRVEHQSHTRLDAISGRPPDMVRELMGCRFAPRCRYAQQRCTTDEPELFDAGQAGHRQACFYPVGSPENAQALAANQDAGVTAAGLDLAAAAVS